MYVGEGQGYPTIQSAVNASADGDTIYVIGGEYREAVVVNKQLTLIGVPNRSMSRPLLTGWPIASAPGTYPAMDVTARGVTVDGFDFVGNLSGWTAGIHVSGQGCTIRNVNVSSCSYGIQAGGADTLITGSRFHANTVGVEMNWATNVTLSRNVFTDNGEGATISWTTGAEIFQNNFINTTGPGVWRSCYSNNVTTNTSVPMPYSFRSGVFTNYSGNYWDNDNGVDNNGDGIADSPYVICKVYPGIALPSSVPQYVNFTDNYPAIRKWSFVNGNAVIEEPSADEISLTSVPAISNDSSDVPLSIRLNQLHVGPGQIYSTIQRAVNASTDGDTIYVHGGVYPEAVVVDKQLTLIGVPNSSGGMPIIAGWPSNETPGMTIINDHVTVENFAIEGDGTYSNGMYVRGGLIETGGTGGPTSRVLNVSSMHDYHIIPGTDFTVRNVKYDRFSKGLVISDYDNVTVTDSVFAEDGAGITLSYAKHVTLSRNNILDTHLGVMSSCSSYIEVYQNNFVNNDYKTIDRYPVADDIKANASTPMPYTFRSQPKVNFTGNYWSNYSGVDQNGDGIGDSPYLIDTVKPSIVPPEGGQEYCNYTDDYPALGMWSFDNGTATIGEPKPGMVITPTATVMPAPTPTSVPAGSGLGVPFTIAGLLAVVAACGRYRFRRKK